MEIRPAHANDIEQLATLFDAYRVFYRKDSDNTAAKHFLSERIAQADSKIFVAEESAASLVGFVQLYPLFSSTRMQKLWLLNDLFVASTARGKGISVALIESCKALVKETKACGMFLETEKTNAIGNQLYPRTGFVLNAGSNFYEWNNTELSR